MNRFAIISFISPAALADFIRAPGSYVDSIVSINVAVDGTWWLAFIRTPEGDAK